MQKNTQESNETRPDTIDRKIRRFRPIMTWRVTPQLRDLSPQGVNIFRTYAKLITELQVRGLSALPWDYRPGQGNYNNAQDNLTNTPVDLGFGTLA